VHLELLHKPENENAQKQFRPFYEAAIIMAAEMPLPIVFQSALHLREVLV